MTRLRIIDGPYKGRTAELVARDARCEFYVVRISGEQITREIPMRHCKAVA